MDGYANAPTSLVLILFLLFTSFKVLTICLVRAFVIFSKRLFLQLTGKGSSSYLEPKTGFNENLPSSVLNSTCHNRDPFLKGNFYLTAPNQFH